MTKLLGKTIRPLIWSLFWLLLLALILRPGLSHLDPDLPWHLKFGRDTWLTRQLPRDQIHLWTLPGATWVDHEWLSNVLMFWSFDRFGYAGLNFIFALVLIGVLGLIARRLKAERPSADYPIMAWLLLGYLAILPHLGPRPQSLSLLFLALELLILDKVQSWHRWKILACLGALFWLWASLHAGFLIGLTLLALWAGEQIIVGWRRQNPKQFWLGLQAACLSFVATLLTPYGFKLYDFLNTYANNAYLTHISEWKAFYVFPLNYWQLLLIALLAAGTIALFNFNGRQKYLRPWQWLSLLLFSGLGLKSVRHFPLFFVVAGLTLAPVLAKFLGATNFNPTRRLKIFLKTSLAIILLALTFFSWWSLPLPKNPFQNFCDDYPCQAARQLQADSRYNQLKLFNKYDYGGWLIWVWPDKRLFIDGRLPQYPLAGWSLLEEYLAFTQPDTLAAKLRDYDIEAVLWNKNMLRYRLNWLDKLLGFTDDNVNNRRNYLKEFLEASPDWSAVFTDQASIVYIRKDKL